MHSFPGYWTHDWSSTNYLERVSNLPSTQANSASYPQQKRK